MSDKIIQHVTIQQREHLLTIIPKTGLPYLVIEGTDEGFKAEDNVNDWEKWHHLVIKSSGEIVGVSAIAYIITPEWTDTLEVVSFDDFCAEIERFKQQNTLTNNP